MTAGELVGTWRLAAFHDVDEAGRVVDDPLGPAPEGLLIYTSDGHVAVSMMRSTPGPGPRYMGYAGRWTASGDRVSHRIEVAERPDWPGTEQTRRAELDGDRLTLHATTTIDGLVRNRVLSWLRA
ncbi:lipocalin-like domain-containing protein [Actinomadura oligospora]|uniref:lipocalin-like domain-containing protein n=1 Tax=Actinomadura oligospora TaxID=111804 RepID=UPI00047B0A2D|nr:lipocalin-like domain-containing protein [Actinomadura oligospora]